MSFGAAVAGAHMARRVGALVSADERQRSRAISEATTDSISVDELQRLEHLFAAADEDGGGDLDEDEFLEGFQDILGASMSPHALRQLFMRVDANSDGSVDWEEFSNYVLLSETTGSDELQRDATQSLDAPTASEFERGNRHRDAISRVVFSERHAQYLTAGIDGELRSWSLQPGLGIASAKSATVAPGAWLSDCALLGANGSHVACAAADHSVWVHDVGSLERVGSGLCALKEPPTRLTSWQGAGASTFLSIGDEGGAISLLSAADPSFVQERLHWSCNAHTARVTALCHLSCLQSDQLATASMDNRLGFIDVGTGVAVNYLNCDASGHKKGVVDMSWSVEDKFLVTCCGSERHATLWNPYTTLPIAQLKGHSASITAVRACDRKRQVFTLSEKAISIWDVRTNALLQAIPLDKDGHTAADRIHDMMYCEQVDCLVTASTSLVHWPTKERLKEKEPVHFSHGAPLCAALYNRQFEVCVSVDATGTVKVWGPSGALLSQFCSLLPSEQDGGTMDGLSMSDDAVQVSAASYDESNRRLLTGNSDGHVRMWNFSSGQLLQTFAPVAEDDLDEDDDGEREIAALLHFESASGDKKQVLATGWDGRVSVWIEEMEGSVGSVVQDLAPSAKSLLRPVRQLIDDGAGDDNDVLCMALQTPTESLGARNVLLVTGLFCGQLVVQRFDSGFVLHRLCEGAGSQDSTSVEAVAFLGEKFSQGRALVAACGGDGVIRIWDAVRGELLVSKPALHTKRAALVSLCLAEPLGRLFVGDAVGGVSAWALHADERGELDVRPLCYWRAHADSVKAIDFVQSSHCILTASADRNVRLWTPDGRQVGTFGQETQWTLGACGTYASHSRAGTAFPVDRANSDSGSDDEADSKDGNRGSIFGTSRARAAIDAASADAKPCRQIAAPRERRPALDRERRTLGSITSTASAGIAATATLQARQLKAVPLGNIDVRQKYEQRQAKEVGHCTLDASDLIELRRGTSIASAGGAWQMPTNRNRTLL